MMRRFVKETVIYGIPTFLAKAMGLLLLPIYTRQLGPLDFGFVEFIAATSAILSIVLPIEINQAVARLLPDSDDQRRQTKIFVTAFLFTTVSFTAFGGLVYLLRLYLFEVANLPIQYAQYALLICLTFLVSALISLVQVTLRFTGQLIPSVIVNMTVVFANVGLVLYFSDSNQLGITEYFLSQVASGFLGLLTGLFFLIQMYGSALKTFDLATLKELLKYSWPIVFSSVGIVSASAVDRWMIGGTIGLAELGYYGVAARFAAIVGLVFYIVSSTLTPIVYRDYEKAETKRLIVSTLKATFIFCFAFLLLTSLFSSQLIGLLAGNQFSQGSQYIFYLTLSAVLLNMTAFFLGMDVFKKTKLLSQINIVSGATAALGCVVFVPVFGIWGAIASSIFANSVRLCGYFYYSQQNYLIRIERRWLSIALLATFLLVLAVTIR
jgi:O-antigen/teichoic acid export membrane protein